MEFKLGSVYSLSNKFKTVKFSELVKASSGFEIIPINLGEKEDIVLIKKITSALNNFVASTRKATRFTGARVNDIGKALEDTITQELLKTDLEVSKLGSSGYPDLVVKHKDKITYIEIKCSGNKSKKITHHRLFYYTSGKKVITNAHHLLLQIELSEEKDKIWIVDSWVLRDLNNLIVGLKTEFNANQQAFDLLGELSSSK